MNRQNLLCAAIGATLLLPAAGCKSTKAQARPTAAATQATPDAPFRAKRPEPSGELHFNPPKPETFKLKNGLVVHVVERHELPLVAVGLLVKTGRDGDPADKQGLAGFTADMLDEGTANMRAPQIAASFEDLAIQFSAEVERGSSIVGINTLTPNLDQALTLFSDVILHPSFSDRDVERVRSERLANLLASHDDPGTVAHDVMLRSLYGDRHPWGAPEQGTVEGNKAIKRGDLQRFHDTYYVPSNCVLVVAGDVKPAELKPMLEKHFTGWKDHRVTQPKLPEPKAASTRSIVLVDKPGAPQSQIWVGSLAITAKDPDLERFEVANDILGGLFSSRLNLNLREGKGWSYGVFSAAELGKGRAPWFAAGGFVAAKSTESVAELVKELDRLHTGDVTDQELAMAKDSEVRSMARLFETDRRTAVTLAELVARDQPIDYYSGAQQKFEAVNADDVKRIAQAHFDPAHMTVVVVGPKAELLEKLKALDLGPVELRDDMGHLLK